MPKIKKMTLTMAIEIANKYVNDMKYFGTVDKDCVSRVCKLLLEEIETLRNINKFDSDLIMEEYYKKGE